MNMNQMKNDAETMAMKNAINETDFKVWAEYSLNRFFEYFH